MKKNIENQQISKKTVVVHSGGMDSSLCLALAIKNYGASEVLAISFTYNQRHEEELHRAELITQKWGVDHLVLDISCLSIITKNALVDKNLKIGPLNGPPNTLVVGRNGLMGRVAAIHANSLGAHSIYIGVIGVESANSGYRDCSREYMDKLQDVLRMDFADLTFTICTPLVDMTKKETMKLGHELGVLNFLLETAITCYEGIDHQGCKQCPACHLRNQGIVEFFEENPKLTRPSFYSLLAL